MQTTVKPCSCKHESQDALHGKGQRVMNLTKKMNGTKKMHRCTVCGALH